MEAENGYQPDNLTEGESTSIEALQFEDLVPGVRFEGLPSPQDLNELYSRFQHLLQGKVKDPSVMYDFAVYPSDISKVIQDETRKRRFNGKLGTSSVLILPSSFAYMSPFQRETTNPDNIITTLAETEMISTGRGVIGKVRTLAQIFSGLSPRQSGQQFERSNAIRVMARPLPNRGHAEEIDNLIMQANATAHDVKSFNLQHAFQGGAPGLGKR